MRPMQDSHPSLSHPQDSADLAERESVSGSMPHRQLSSTSARSVSAPNAPSAPAAPATAAPITSAPMASGVMANAPSNESDPRDGPQAQQQRQEQQAQAAPPPAGVVGTGMTAAVAPVPIPINVLGGAGGVGGGVGGVPAASSGGGAPSGLTVQVWRCGGVRHTTCALKPCRKRKLTSPRSHLCTQFLTLGQLPPEAASMLLMQQQQQQYPPQAGAAGYNQLHQPLQQQLQQPYYTNPAPAAPLQQQPLMMGAGLPVVPSYPHAEDQANAAAATAEALAEANAIALEAQVRVRELEDEVVELQDQNQ